MINFKEIQPDLKEILSMVSEEAIMRYYLGVPVVAGIFNSPLRKDNKPSCSFWRSPKSKKLYFKDWSKDLLLDAVGVVQYKYNLTYPRALNKIKLDLNKISLQNPAHLPEKISSLIQVSVRESFDKFDLNYWNKYGITESTLKLYNVLPVKNVYVDKRLTWKSTTKNPIFAYSYPSGKIKVYRPLNPKQESKWFSNVVDELDGWNVFLKGRKRKSLIILTSSCKDAMCLYELGFPAISLGASETVNLHQAQIDTLTKHFRYKFVLMDNDDTGRKANEKYSRQGFIPLYLTKEKDISDFRKKYKKKKTLKTIKHLIKNSVSSRNTELPF